MEINDHTVRFLDLVAQEVARKRSCGKKRIRGFHEAWGRIQEEVDEFKDEVKKKEGKRDLPNALHELVQVAATAMRAAEDLGLLHHAREGYEP